MTIKTLCLFLFDSTEAPWLIEKTCTLAMALDAHVTCVHPYTPVIYVGGIGAEPMIYPTLQEWEAEESAKIRAMFEERIRKDDIRGEYRQQNTLYGSEDFLLSCGRGADLAVIGSNESETRSPDDRSLAARVIRAVGRPVLVFSPGTSLDRPAKHLTIGWSETREATRAAHDALLLAAPGAQIDLVSILSRADDNPPGLDSRDDLAAALDRRGFKVNAIDRIASATNLVQELQAIAHEQSADLLATGAFGHSQIYDFVIGAVTRDLLKSPSLPLVLSK